MSGQHAPLAPSSAHRWANCAGSVALIAALPPEMDGPEAIEGTTAHYVAAMLASQGYLLGLEDSCPETNLQITHEMQMGATMYVEHIRRTATASHREWTVHVEEKVLASAIHAECEGTPDAWRWNPDEDVLDVYDYKFGHGFVEVFGNEQLICYVSGIITLLGGAIGPNTRIRCHIIQPRSYGPEGPVRTWEATGVGMLGHIGRLHEAAIAAIAPDALCHVGDWCDYCPARHVCVALQRAAGRIADVAAQPVPFNLTPTAMGFELTALTAAKGLLEARIDGLRAEAESALRSGKYVPGWEMRPGQSRLRWNDEQLAIQLGEMFDKPVARTAVCTPTQARDMGIDESVIFTYASRTPAAMKLVPVNLTDVKKVLAQ